MSTFTTPLSFQECGDFRWQITELFVYYIGTPNDKILTEGHPVFVPKGFITDGASVPRMLWWLFPPVGDRYSKAAVLHDFMYSTQMFGRSRADKIFLEAMEALGVSWWKRRTLYSAVRVFGHAAWVGKSTEEMMRWRDASLSQSYEYYSKKGRW